MATTQVEKNIRISGSTSPSPDYTSLVAWEAAMQSSYPNLVTSDVDIIANCYGDWSSGLSEVVTISGFTTNSTHRIIIQAADGEQHSGIPETGFWLRTTVSWVTVLNVSDENVDLIGIGIDCATVGPVYRNAQGIGFAGAYGVGCTVSNCIVWNAGTYNDYNEGAAYYSIEADVNNCIAIAQPTGYFGFSTHGYRKGSYRNSVSVGFANGFVGSANSGYEATAINCVAHDCATPFTNPTNWSTDTDYNASGTGGTTTPPGANSYATDTEDSDFIDAANNDYHLSPSSNLIGIGENLYDSSDTQADIDGDLWPDSAWSIGADYIPAASTSPITNDSDIRWDLVENILGSADIRWNIEELIESAIDMRWDITAALSAITNDLTVQWSIINQITADIDAQWNLLEAVGADSNTRWDIVEAVAQELTAQWDILSAVGVVASDVTLTWNGLEQIDGGIIARWNIDGIASADVPGIRVVAIPARDQQIKITDDRVFSIGQHDATIRIH